MRRDTEETRFVRVRQCEVRFGRTLVAGNVYSIEHRSRLSLGHREHRERAKLDFVQDMKGQMCPSKKVPAKTHTHNKLSRLLKLW